MLHGQHGMAGAAHPVGDLGQLARQQRQQLLRMGHQSLGDIDQTQAVRLQRLAQQLLAQLQHDLLCRSAPVFMSGMSDGKQ